MYVIDNNFPLSIFSTKSVKHKKVGISLHVKKSLLHKLQICFFHVKDEHLIISTSLYKSLHNV